jgi:pseudaminic acid cytidylyltransferase
MRVAIIPARGGSRRIPRKNIRHFFGMPIMARSILSAEQTNMFHHIFVSTDDEEIAEVAKRYGASVIVRGPSLSVDEVGTQEVMRHAILSLPKAADEACCIYATAPLLTPADLIQGWGALRGQGMPYAFVPGLYYWGHGYAFAERVPLHEGFDVPFPQERYVDINDESDWQKAEEMYRRVMARHGEAR